MLWEWIAYSRIEPFDEERADLRAGIVASVIANTNRKKGSPPFKAKDFMPKYGRRQQQWQDQLKIVEMLNQAFGGDDLRTDEQKEWQQ